ncbi:ABC transporter permease [Fundicoccus culcitae]|uniref:ABC transporter permease subunit n=1 Tax=Fundicoccus culcitae TaxID=2969821 RepID=A0ABY5P3S9_9LACT|nr:ABC transporter permease subunit [Fundicoccus culcitae]UUX33155.1 ABC transporter permease subunit [Fundicoccus culcitae]
MNAAVKPKRSVRIKRWFKKFFEQWELQTMVWPGVIFMLIFNFLPIYGLTIAFRSYTVMDTMQTAPWVGFDNFEIILRDKFFWDSVVNTLAISLLKVALGFFLPIILAVMIFELRQGPFKKLVQTISYMPYFLSWIVLGGMLINWLSTTGLLNTILAGLGFNIRNQNYLLSADNYYWIAVLSDIWKNTGWGTILYLATLSKIDPTYYEAAKIDGATRMQQVTKITLPMLRSIISLNLILTISGLLGSNLDQTMVLMNNQNRPRAEVINSYVFDMGIAQGDFSYATAVGLGISIVSVILLLISNQMTKRLNDNTSVL